MQFSAALTAAPAALTIAALGPDGRFSPTLQRFNQAADGLFSRLQETQSLPSKVGQRQLFIDVAGQQRLLLVVCDDLESKKEAARAALALARERQWATVACHLADSETEVQALAEALGAADYVFEDFKSEKRPALDWHWQFVGLTAPTTLARARAFIAGNHLTRRLVNLPANVCTPAYLGEQAEALGRQFPTLKVEVLGLEQIRALGMGGVLGVSQGSRNEPRFIVIDYQPAGTENTPPLVLVGKGVTFDTGGISIKPAAAMDEMKGDMGGAAAVFGALRALAEEGLSQRVVGLVASVENMPDGQALRPGDIITSLAGKTVEVLNTDAEGRLILMDALSYAERFQPRAVIDMATLTGAIVIGLGSHRAGLVANNQALSDALFAAGERAGDKVWPLPLDREYRDMLKSPNADWANISGSREAGALTAAAFLSIFSENYPWAHLDIAGVAFRSSAPKGATGRPLGLLLEYFRSL